MPHCALTALGAALTGASPGGVIVPNLFHLDWDRTLETLVLIVVLSFFVERACALVVESRLFIFLFEDQRVKPRAGTTATADAGADPGRAGVRLLPVKEVLAFAVALLVCRVLQLDAISILVVRDQVSSVGLAITAAVIAGGSKASIKLFHDVMNLRSSAEVERKRLRAIDRGEDPDENPEKKADKKADPSSDAKDRP